MQNKTTFQIRNLNFTDVSSVYKLGQSIFDWPTERILWSSSIVRWYFEQSRAVCFVAEKENSIIGFILCFVVQNTGRIEWIAVNEAFQHIGVATELLRRVLSIFKMNNILNISTLTREDGKANKFFIQNEFQNRGLRKTEMFLGTQKTIENKNDQPPQTPVKGKE